MKLSLIALALALFGTSNALRVSKHADTKLCDYYKEICENPQSWNKTDCGTNYEKLAINDYA